MEDIRFMLESFQSVFNENFFRYLEKKTAEIKKGGWRIHAALEDVAPIITKQGKRLRPFLCFLGNTLGDGKETHRIVLCGIALELLHVFALIQDDIIDRADTRRGEQAVHLRFAQKAEANKKIQNPMHIGESQAMLLSDLIYSFAHEAFAQAVQSHPMSVSLLEVFSSLNQEMISGQYEDVSALGSLATLQEEDLFRILKSKSGMYTIERPLRLGLMFSEAPESIQRDVSLYSVPLGIAFQMRDDILGTFGDSKVTGKSVNSDIREGKPTFLAWYAMCNAASSDRKIMDGVFGNPKATQEDCDQVRKIFESSGAVTAALKRSDELLSDAKKLLEGSALAANHRHILAAFADYLVARTS